MAKRPSSIGRLRVAAESTFGTDQTSSGTSISGFLDVPFTKGTFKGGRPDAFLPANVAEQRKGYKTVFDLLGPKSCAPAFDMNLHSHGVSIDGDATPPDSTTWALGLLLKYCLGAERTATDNSAQTQVQAGTTTTVINVTTGHGANWEKGSAIAVPVNGKLEAREVLSVATDAISLKVALSAVPDTNDPVYQAVTYHPTNTTDPGTLQLVYEALETSCRFGYFGCKGGFTLGLTNRQLAAISFALQGVDWAQFSTASLAAATYANYNGGIPIKDSEFIVGTVGSTTRNLITNPSRDWTVGLQYAPHETGAGVNNVAGWERLSDPIISGNIGALWDGDEFDFEAAYANRTELAFFQQLGATAGSCILLSAPSVQVGAPQEGDVNGLLGKTFPWMGRGDQSLSSPTTDLHYAELRVHCF